MQSCRNLHNSRASVLSPLDDFTAIVDTGVVLVEEETASLRAELKALKEPGGILTKAGLLRSFSKYISA